MADREQEEVKALRVALVELDGAYDQEGDDELLITPTAKVVRHLARLFLWAHEEGRI